MKKKQKIFGKLVNFVDFKCIQIEFMEIKVILKILEKIGLNCVDFFCRVCD